MELIERTLQEENVDRAIKSVKKNNGAPGVDGMTTDELDGYFALYREEVKEQIRKGRYSPSPVRRVYIPKANGKKRPLGIPTVVDRTVQQAVLEYLSGQGSQTEICRKYGIRSKSKLHSQGAVE